MESRHYKNRPNRRITDLLVSVSLVVIILVLAIPFFNKMMENFEKTVVDTMVQQLNSAATFKMAESVALDKLGQLHKELEENPIQWIGAEDLTVWEHYKGEVESLDFDEMEEQTWIYDRRMGRLIYKVKYPHLLKNEDPVENRIQFEFVMDYVDFNEDGRFNADTDTINGVKIVSVHPYDWIQKDDE